MKKRIYELDGSKFSTLEEFYEEVSKVLIPRFNWGKNLNALNDILRGGFGTPDEGFIIRWKNTAESKKKLGYPETVKQLEKQLAHCHPANRDSVSEALQSARNGKGEVVFDWLVEIILDHGQGGDQEEDGVELVLS